MHSRSYLIYLTCSIIAMLRELCLLAALLTVSAAARLIADDTMDGEKLEDLEEPLTNVAEKEDVYINDEDEQLREALDAMVTTYLQQKESKLKYYETSEISSMSKSPYIGVMRAYLARKYLSSSSALTQEELHAAGLSCSVCVKAVDWAVPKITKWGCGVVFGASATAFCNAIGLGPEDPLTWACTSILIGSCSKILQQIRKNAASSTAICQKFKSC